MGIPLAVALLTILFHHHNQKFGVASSILSARASYNTDCSSSDDRNIRFGIIKKTQTPYIDSWIFGPQIRGSLPQVSPNELTEINLSPDVEHIASIQDMLVFIQSSMYLYELSQNLHELSNHSPLLNQTMIPFMSSVSCLFEHVDSTSTDPESDKRLSDIVDSWGFQIHSVAGDGNCCFHALAFTIQCQRHNIELRLPQLFLDLCIERTASVDDIACQLRRIAVEEWMTHADDYQCFLGDEPKVTEEAPMFLQQGHFFGPLGNTMVVAISNALGLPVIVFSSASHYPVINIKPRECRAPIPLYVAFNQSSAGHYNAVTFKNDPPIPSTSQHSTVEANTSKCTCGKSDKHYSTTQRCVIMQFKYTTSTRCPCLLAGHACTFLCACHNCGNPNGIKPQNICSKVRQRKKHAWSLKSSKSIMYARQQQEKVLPGPRTQLEYLLISEILNQCRKKEIDADLDIVQKLYLSCVELTQVLELSIPLGPKTLEDISKIVDEYERHRKVFEATCIAQLQINST